MVITVAHEFDSVGLCKLLRGGKALFELFARVDVRVGIEHRDIVTLFTQSRHAGARARSATRMEQNLHGDFNASS